MADCVRFGVSALDIQRQIRTRGLHCLTLAGGLRVRVTALQRSIVKVRPSFQATAAAKAAAHRLGLDSLDMLRILATRSPQKTYACGNLVVSVERPSLDPIIVDITELAPSWPAMLH